MASRIQQRFKVALARSLAPVIIGWNWRGAKAQDLSVRDETMPVRDGKVRLRIYTPQGNGPFPVVLFFHGGGWVFGNLGTHDAVCRDLCVQGKRLVVAVDYRLAPEFAFPVPVEDCLASLAWMRDNALRLGGDLESLVVCGDSSGGNLAAVVTQQARSSFPGLITGQILVYPVTDHCAHSQRESYEKYGGKQYGLSHEDMSEFWDMYLQKSTLWQAGMTSHDLATPLKVQDLAGLPHSLFVIAEEDMLSDEAAAYAGRLRDAGTAVELRSYSRQRHGFFGLAPTEPYKQAIGDISAWLERTQPESEATQSEIPKVGSREALGG